MDFDSLFPFNPAVDTYNGDLEGLVRDEDQKNALNRDYKERFLSNKEGQRKYTAIVKKQMG